MARLNTAAKSMCMASFASQCAATVEGCHCGEYANALSAWPCQALVRKPSTLQPLHTAASSVARAGKPGSRVMVNGKTECSSQEHVHGLICFAGRRMATVEGYHCGKSTPMLGLAVPSTVREPSTLQPLHISRPAL
jgi:hypothetical protein